MKATTPEHGKSKLKAAAHGETLLSQGQLSDTNVAAWLKQHPQFFHKHPDLLLQLSIPHESGTAISLLERQVAVFRERQSALHDQIQEFFKNARNNDNLFEKTRAVILELLHCTNLAALQRVITDKLRIDFAASAAALVFVSDLPESVGVTRLPTAAVRTALGNLMQKPGTYCGPLNWAQKSLLFPKQIPTIISAAIVPLQILDSSRIRRDYGFPLLLIGSSEDNQFNSSLDTLFLDFIGEVLTSKLQTIIAAS